MPNRLLLGCFILLWSGLLRGQDPAALTVFTHTSLVDGLTATVREDVQVWVKGGKIEAVLPANTPFPKDAREINLQGKYMLPGLIDAHVHLDNLQDAQRALLTGVTTVRSMGVPHFTDVGMRALARSGQLDLPEVLAAGYHIRPRPDEGIFLDEPGLVDLMGQNVVGEEALGRITYIMLKHKVDWIKVNATARAGLPQTDPREPYYSADELRIIVEAGAKQGVPVAAHAHGDEGGLAAVQAGVRSIEHGTYLSEETLRLMAAQGTFLVPTIAVVKDLTEAGGDYDTPVLRLRGHHMLPRVREMTTMAHRLGVKIVAATDTGYSQESLLRLPHELEELVGVGLSPLEAIQSATTLAAELLNISDHTGRIAVGFDADILVVERNPLLNVGVLHDPLLIMNNGKMVLNRLSW